MGRTRRYSRLLLRKVINRHKSNPSSVRSACWGQNQSDGFLKTVKTGNVFRFWRVICRGGGTKSQGSNEFTSTQRVRTFLFLLLFSVIAQMCPAVTQLFSIPSPTISTSQIMTSRFVE